MLCGGSAVWALAGCGAERQVFAHYMVCIPTFGARSGLAEYQEEIRAAQAAGIDGFALNCGGWSVREPHYKRRAQLIYQAAKDLGTGNEQKVTITASTNMSKEEIDRAVKEAEQFAAQDKKEKERVEIRNNADALVFQTERTLKDLGAKVSSEDKARIEAEISSVRSALNGTDTDAIKAAADKLSQVSYEVFGKVYSQQNAAGAGPGPGGAQSAPHDDNVVDADYEVVDDDKQNK